MFRVQIRKSSTGEVRSAPCAEAWDDATYFGWLLNNYACDCVRPEEFAKAGNEPVEQHPSDRIEFTAQALSRAGLVLSEDENWRGFWISAAQ